MSDSSLDDIERRLQDAHAAARSVWRRLPGPVARPNYGWWCKRHDSVHTGRDYRAVDGELVCPEAENRDLTTLFTDGGKVEDGTERICPICGAGSSFTVPVWEDMADYESGASPDHIGCTECCTMRSVDTASERDSDD